MRLSRTLAFLLLSQLAFGRTPAQAPRTDRDPALMEIVRLEDDIEKKKRLEAYLESAKDEVDRQTALVFLLGALLRTDDERTVEYADRILADTKSDSRTRYEAWLTKLHWAHKKGDQAKVGALRRQILDNEDNALLLSQVGAAFDRENMLPYMEKAARIADSRESMHPRTRALLFSNYAHSLAEAGRTAEAVQYAEKALSSQLANLQAVKSGAQDMHNTPESLEKNEVASAHLLLAFALAKSERAAEGLQHINEAIRMNRDFLIDRGPEIWRTRGQIHSRLGRKEEALDSFLQSYASSKSAEAWADVVRIASETGRTEADCRQRLLEIQQVSAKVLPDSRFRNLQGQEVALADFKTPVLLINFFFPSCGPCNQEMPHLQKLQDKYRDKGLTVVAINTLSSEDEQLPNWRQKGGYTFSILLTPDRDYLEKKIEQRAAPTTLLVNGNRRIVLRKIGFEKGDEQSLEQEILELLPAEKQSKP